MSFQNSCASCVDVIYVLRMSPDVSSHTGYASLHPVDPDVTVSSKMNRKRGEKKSCLCKNKLQGHNLNLVQELDDVCGQRTLAKFTLFVPCQFSQIAFLRAYFFWHRKCGRTLEI